MVVWLFDIDGTLIASRGAGQAATFAAVTAAFNSAAPQADVRFAGRTDRAIAEDVFRAHGIENNLANWLAFRRSYLQQLRMSLPRHAGQVLTGVVELLEHLRRIPDHHLGLLTGNIREGAREKLSHYGLWDRFDFGGFGDEFVSRDDVARAALADATRHLSREISPNDVYVVGDTVHDIRCARAINARAIAVATGGASYDELAAEAPDHLWTDLSEWREQLAVLGRDELAAGP